MSVEVPLKPEDMPGKLLRRQCAHCGETVMDGREIETSSETLCKRCFEKVHYYRVLNPIDSAK